MNRTPVPTKPLSNWERQRWQHVRLAISTACVRLAVPCPGRVGRLVELRERSSGVRSVASWLLPAARDSARPSSAFS